MPRALLSPRPAEGLTPGTRNAATAAQDASRITSTAPSGSLLPAAFSRRSSPSSVTEATPAPAASSACPSSGIGCHRMARITEMPSSAVSCETPSTARSATARATRPPRKSDAPHPMLAPSARRIPAMALHPLPEVRLGRPAPASGRSCGRQAWPGLSLPCPVPRLRRSPMPLSPTRARRPGRRRRDRRGQRQRYLLRAI